MPMSASKHRPGVGAPGTADSVIAGCESAIHNRAAIGNQSTPIAVDTAVTVAFFKTMFPHTTHSIWLCSLPNEKGDEETGPEDHIRTRDENEIIKFVTDYADDPLRSTYFCIGTIEGRKRNKSNVRELPSLHVDIDFKHVIDDETTILRRIRALRLPPSMIVRSGHGLHCYWFMKEPMTADDVDRIELALKLLCDLVGGDMQVTQIAALMRVPGSINSKACKDGGDAVAVTIIENNAGRFELDDIEEMLAETSIKVLRKERELQHTVGESDFFTDYATRFGLKPPIDVEKRLTTMTYMGGKEASIHDTQLRVSASLLEKGVETEEIVKIALEATRAAAGDYGTRWNWQREEKAIRKMCLSWLKKHPREESDDDEVGTEQDGNINQDTKDGEERIANQAPVAKILPVIRIKPRISVVTSNTQKMLVGAKVPFYQRGGELVRPIIRIVKAAHGRLTKTAQLKTISATFMRDTMCRHALWERFDKRTEDWVPAAAPMNVAQTLLDRDGVWRFPEIVGVIATPTMRPDGSLFIKQGYDPATRLLLIEPPPMPEIPDEPTRDDALEALALLEELISESPFDDEPSRSVALSGLITPVVRGAFPVAPMHVSSAPVAGSGKSFLWDLVAAISTGQQRIPVIAAGNAEETEKRLVGVMLNAQPLISIDNVNGELKGDFLCQAIEQHVLDIRPLGRSEIVRIETGGVTIFATGNNITIVGDLCRRTITSRLDSKLEHPQLRQFKNNPIRKI